MDEEFKKKNDIGSFKNIARIHLFRKFELKNKINPKIFYIILHEVKRDLQKWFVFVKNNLQSRTPKKML